MKKLILIAALFFTLSVSVFAQYYYYSDGIQIPLQVDSSKVMILFDDGLTPNIDDFVRENLDKWLG